MDALYVTASLRHLAISACRGVLWCVAGYLSHSAPTLYIL